MKKTHPNHVTPFLEVTLKKVQKIVPEKESFRGYKKKFKKRKLFL